MGPQNNRHNADPQKDNSSGMLLRFSTDAGTTYYNYEDPRNTFPLDRSSPRRKLTYHPGSCHPAVGTVGGVSTFPWFHESFLSKLVTISLRRGNTAGQSPTEITVKVLLLRNVSHMVMGGMPFLPIG